MNYYVTVTDKGIPTNFYHDDNSSLVISQDIPKDAIKISREVYDKLGSGKFALLDNKLISYIPPPNYVSSTDVDLERDKKLNNGFVYQNKQFQTDEKSILNILCNVQIAQMAVLNGIKAGDLKWRDSSDFSWICTDNTNLPMDAYTFIDFFKSLIQYRSRIVQSGRIIKNKLSEEKTLDIFDIKHW